MKLLRIQQQHCILMARQGGLQVDIPLVSVIVYIVKLRTRLDLCTISPTRINGGSEISDEGIR